MSDQPPPNWPSPIVPWHNKAYPAIDPSLPALSTAGKSIVITGGGTTIGAAAAHAFATSGAAHIAILGRRLQPLLETAAAVEAAHPATKVHTHSTDITDAAAVQAALSAFVQATGTGVIDVLVANAGFLPEPNMLAAADADDWWTGFETNVRGAFNTARAFLPLAANEGASIINVSSVGAHCLVQYLPALSGYSASKAAAIRFWDYFAQENQGIHLLHVNPGVIDSAMERRNPMDPFVPHDDGECGVLGVDASSSAQPPSFVYRPGSSSFRLAEYVLRLTFGVFLVGLPAAFFVWAVSPEARFLRGRFIWANWDVGTLKSLEPVFKEDPWKFKLGLYGWP